MTAAHPIKGLHSDLRLVVDEEPETKEKRLIKKFVAGNSVTDVTKSKTIEIVG